MADEHGVDDLLDQLRHLGDDRSRLRVLRAWCVLANNPRTRTRLHNHTRNRNRNRHQIRERAVA